MSLSLNQKLKLSQRQHCLTLFNDKAFVKAYNESAYVLSCLLGKQLKPLVFRMRHYPFQLVVMVSIPKSYFLDRFMDIEKTGFGYEVKVSYDLSMYSEWLVANEIYCGKPQ